MMKDVLGKYPLSMLTEMHTIGTKVFTSYVAVVNETPPMFISGFLQVSVSHFYFCSFAVRLSITVYNARECNLICHGL